MLEDNKDISVVSFNQGFRAADTDGYLTAYNNNPYEHNSEYYNAYNRGVLAAVDAKMRRETRYTRGIAILVWTISVAYFVSEVVSGIYRAIWG